MQPQMRIGTEPHVPERQGRRDSLDPTGEIDLEDTVTVEKVIKQLLDDNYGTGYDKALLSRAIDDLIKAYRGEYPGILRCDTLYHDLRHALETGLTMARLIDGHAKSRGYFGVDRIDGDQALLAVLLALYHDVGLLRRGDEAHLFGPVLIPIHEERGVEFMQTYLAGTSLDGRADWSRLIMATKLNYQMPPDWSPLERLLGGMIGSADLLGQCADRCYLEKCRDFLFTEFSALGLAGTPDSPYPDRETLLAKTPAFYSGLVRQRLEGELGGVYELLAAHTGKGNPWIEAIERNVEYLQDILQDKDFGRLRRRPDPFI